jgi:hypothetical protein
VFQTIFIHMIKDIPSTVKCSITGVEHRVAHGETNKNELDLYLNDIYKRTENESVNIALDCEGYVLGLKDNSLGLIMIAECFTPNLFEVSRSEKISINLKPGFLIKTPISEDTKILLSKVLWHGNVTVITFDFTHSIAAMNEAGIKVNMRKVIDSQPSVPLSGINNFTFTKFQGLKAVCEKATNCVEYKAVVRSLKNKEKVDFDYLNYVAKDAENPFDERINAKYWEYAASEIALTAVALVEKLGSIKADTIKECSSSKSKAFLWLQKTDGLRAPAVIRFFSYIRKDFLLSKIKSKRDAYKLYSKVDGILDNFELYEKYTEEDQRCTKEELLAQRSMAVKIIEA